MAITMLPYLLGYWLQGANPRFGWYTWLGYNFDDSCVYLSWMRQAADGNFFQRNLFTTEPQSGQQFNVFFLVLGNIARFTHLPLIAVWHFARIALGVALLRAVWWLIELLGNDDRARKAAFLLVCFSSGLGWIPGLWAETGFEAPVDVWQPEAITFLTLYLNPLFNVSLLLMVGMLGWLLVAEQTKSIWPAIRAGFCGFLLGNIHTYDVITVTIVWGTYLLIRSLRTRKPNIGSWARAVVAGLPTAVTTGYVAFQLKTETVFAQRAAVETQSPPILQYALGFGLLLVLSLVGLIAAWRAGRTIPENTGQPTDDLLFLAVWAAANLAVAYLPVPFQRKMIMGEHLPLAILGGIGVASLLKSITHWNWEYSCALAGVVLVTSLTNIRFIVREATNVTIDLTQSLQRPFIYAGERRAMDWIRVNAPPNVPIQPLPWIAKQTETKYGFYDTTLAALAPGLTDHAVNAGHWGETPDFARTMAGWIGFQLPSANDDSRKALLRETGVRYLIFSHKRTDSLDPGAGAAVLVPFGPVLPDYLRRIPEASNSDADVFEVLDTG